MTRRTGKAQRVCLQFVIVPVVILLERVRLAKLLTSTRLTKPQQNPQSRWTSVTSAGSSQQATLLRTIITQQKGKKEVKGAGNTATRKKKMAPPRPHPFTQSPFFHMSYQRLCCLPSPFQGAPQ